MRWTSRAVDRLQDTPMPRIRNEELGEEKRQRLLSQIDLLREAVHCLLTWNVAVMVFSYQDCGTFREVSQWRLTTIERVLELAEPRPAREMGEPLGSGTRAYCPLCKCSSASGRHQGFAFPDGLRNHLLGARRADECLIMEAARLAAQAHVDDEIAQQLRPRRLEDKRPKR
jgi:hypothetical protein